MYIYIYNIHLIDVYTFNLMEADSILVRCWDGSKRVTSYDMKPDDHSAHTSTNYFAVKNGVPGFPP